MRLIQKYLPDPRHREINRIFVQAKPETAWNVARHFDAAKVPWVRLLFDIRAIPDYLRGNPRAADFQLGVDYVAEHAEGFFIAGEIPGRDVVVAAVGQFWHLNIPFARVAPDAFSAFQEPGWGKLAWSISVEPYREGSTISLELRTSATDEDSWRQLEQYYRFIGLGSRPIRRSAMKLMEKQLVRLKLEEADEIRLPGDDFLPDAPYHLDHAALIEAPSSLVWRYIMQLGCDRAGWYSYDALDNGGKPSVDHLVPGWETRAPGDKVALSPEQDFFYEVYRVEPERLFLVGGEVDRLGGHFRMTWSFVLDPVGADACRLFTRVRFAGTPDWSAWLAGSLVYPPLHGIMESEQLRNIKRLAERDALLR